MALPTLTQAAQVAIKRITISKASANVKLEVELGEEPGSSEYTVYLMSDSYQAIGGWRKMIKG